MVKYEKKVGDIEDVFFLVVRFDFKKDGDGEIYLNVEEVKKGNVLYEKFLEVIFSGVSFLDL